MKVVLTQDVPNLGKAGDIREVAASYGHNYLIPRGYAAPASKGTSKQVQADKVSQLLAGLPVHLYTQVYGRLNAVLDRVHQRETLPPRERLNILSLLEQLGVVFDTVHDHETPFSLLERLNDVFDSASDQGVDNSLIRPLLELPSDQAELLQKINQDLPPELGQRYRVLLAKRDAEELTPDQHKELLSLTDQVEQLEAQRVAYLVELARLRNTTVTVLIQEPGIHPSVYA